jgi:cytochrome c-type biogenesis protein CcmH
LYGVVSNYTWQDPSQLAQNPPAQDAGLEEVVAKLERRLAETPDDREGWRLLGRTYLVMGRGDSAVNAYQRAYEVGGRRDVEAGLDLAEAMVLMDDAKFDARAKPLVDAALAANASNTRALWYSGVIAARSDDVATARVRWTAMLEQNPPPNVRDILVRQLLAMGATPESLGAAGAGVPTPPTGASPPVAASPAGRAIEVHVDIDKSLVGRLTPGVALFVSARQPGIPGPPLAAVRMTADRWPVNVQLSDANAMIAGRNLSSVDDVEVTARIAFGGTAMTTSGDLIGRATQKRSDTGPLRISIDTIAP